MEDVGSILHRLMSSGPIAELAEYAPIWTEWNSLVGDELARSMSPQRVSEAKLLIAVSSDAMRHRFHLQKNEILARINARLKGPVLTDILLQPERG